MVSSMKVPLLRMDSEPDKHNRNGTPTLVRRPGLEGFDLDAFMMSDAITAQLPQSRQQQKQTQQQLDHTTKSTAQSLTFSSSFAGDPHTSTMNPVNGRPSTISSSDEQQQEQQQQKQPPAWTELKTKAGKDRKRLPLACIACRRKKIRCSGEKPACKHCSKSRIPCVYKVTLRKPAPRTDYMTMLDKRLRRMEERVLRTIPKEELKTMPSVARAIVRPSASSQLPSKATTTTTATTATTTTTASKKRSAGEAFGSGLEQWARKPSSTQTPTIANDDNSRVPQPRQCDERSLLIEGAESLPSLEIQEHLVQTYFDYVYGQSYLLLHKPSFMRRLEAGDVAPVLMLAVCAISARYSNLPELRTEPAFLRGEGWANAAREISLKRFETPNLTVLIVYLLLGLHEFGTCRGGRSWMYGGMAQRMAYALQLHKDLEYDPLSKTDGKPTKFSPIDREIRRRVMWSCFLMDRFNSSGTDRPMFANEQYLSLQLPIKESLFLMEIPGVTENLDGSVTGKPPAEAEQMVNAKANMGASAYAIRIVAIWGRFVQYFNLGGRRTDSYPMWSPHSIYQKIVGQMEAFKASLPPFLQYTSENLQTYATENIANQFLYMHILFRQTLLFANRFAFPAISTGGHVVDKMPSAFLADARRTALNAATMISDIIQDSEHHRLVVPFAGYSAYLSSAVHVHGAFSKTQSLQELSREKLAINVKYLTKAKKRWGTFHYLTESLKDLYRQHADAAARGISTPTLQGRTKRVFQYGDWYDKYPHGVSRADYEEPDEEASPTMEEETVLAKKSDLQSVEEFYAIVATSASNRRRGSAGGRGSGAKKRKSGKGTDKTTTKAAAPSAEQSHKRQRQLSATSQAHASESGSRPQMRGGDDREGASSSHLDSMQLPPALASVPPSSSPTLSAVRLRGSVLTGQSQQQQQQQQHPQASLTSQVSVLAPPPLSSSSASSASKHGISMGMNVDMQAAAAASAAAVPPQPLSMPGQLLPTGSLDAAAAFAASSSPYGQGLNGTMDLMWEGMDLGNMSMMNMPEFSDFGLHDPTGAWALPFNFTVEPGMEYTDHHHHHPGGISPNGAAALDFSLGPPPQPPLSGGTGETAPSETDMDMGMREDGPM